MTTGLQAHEHCREVADKHLAELTALRKVADAAEVVSRWWRLDIPIIGPSLESSMTRLVGALAEYQKVKP